MIKSEPVVIIQTPRTLRQRIDNFIESQANYCAESRRHYLERYKSELFVLMSKDGMTDSQLLMGLELNNYIRQLEELHCKIGKVNYNVGGNCG